MKITALLAGATLFATSAAAQASIFCKRVGDDPYGMAQELVILDDDQASLFFSMPDGEVKTIGLSCHVIEKDPYDGALCQRTSETDGRVSVAQYLITEISPSPTPMMITEFTYSDPAKTDQPHSGTYEGFSVRCIQE